MSILGLYNQYVKRRFEMTNIGIAFVTCLSIDEKKNSEQKTTSNKIFLSNMIMGSTRQS